MIIAIVLQALGGLGRTAARTRPLAALGLLSLAAAAAGGHELAVIFGAGAISALVAWARAGRTGPRQRDPRLAAGRPGLAAATAGATPFSLTSLFLVFLRIGSVLFGSGYVLLAFLRADLVVRRGWLTEGQLLDAIAVGQVTPGPVFTTATFVGYLLGGLGGAVAATVGIFLPAFVFVALSGPLVPRIRRSPVAGAFLDGVNVASIALMALVTAQLARRRSWTPGRRGSPSRRGPPPPLPREPGVAGARRRPARPRPPPLACRARANRLDRAARRGDGSRGGGEAQPVDAADPRASARPRSSPSRPGASSPSTG